MPRRNDRDLVKLLERHPGKGESSPIRIAYPFLPYDLYQSAQSCLSIRNSNG